MTDTVPDTEDIETTDEISEGTQGPAEPTPEEVHEETAASDEIMPEEVEGADESDDEVEGAIDSELEALQNDFEALNDRHLRLAAEFNNYRRRVDTERLGMWARAQAELVGRFLDVLDDLQRVAALDLSNATVEGIMEGIDLVERKFVRVLTESGAEVIDPVGEPFDPERMEAMMRAPAESEEDDDVVAEVYLKGYSLKGELVRPARVSVFKFG